MRKTDWLVVVFLALVLIGAVVRVAPGCEGKRPDNISWGGMKMGGC